MKYQRLLLIVATVLAASGAAHAHDGAMGVVKERMDAMKLIGKNMKTVGQMLGPAGTFDADLVARAGEAIAGHAGNAMTELFPQDSLQPPSEASPEIWTQWQRFSGFAQSLEASALEMSTLASQGADQATVAAAFGKVGATCKSCHQSFRVRK